MMGLKTVGTLTFEACWNCQHGVRRHDDCNSPSLYREHDGLNVGCADYLSIEESEE